MLSRAFTIAVALLMCAAVVAAQGGYNAGAAWLRMTPGDRLTWVWGASEGQTLIIEELKGVPPSLKNLIPTGKADVLSEVMTQLYRDAANAYIPWKYMAVVATMKLGGASDETVNQRLSSLREYAAYLSKF